MSTQTGVAEQRLTAVADAALRAGSRAKVAASALVGLAVMLLAARPGANVSSMAWGLVASVAGLVAFHSLLHGYHHGHDEGRRSAWVALWLSTGPAGPLVLAVAIKATGGRGSGRRV